MKKKFSSMWRVGIALVLVLSLGLVMAAPVAATVSTPAVTVDPITAGDAAEYTIVFTTTQDLAASIPDDIRIEFPTGTTIPADITEAEVTVNGDVVTTATTNGQLVTLVVAVDVPTGVVTVVFTLAADIQNPADAGSYTLDVSTTREVTPVTSSSYSISLPAPTVTDAEPPEANQGETLDIVITGTNFSDDATVSFGAGITIDLVTVVSVTQITAGITIAADATVATRDVSVTTTIGTGTDTTGFEVLASGTGLVDIYDAAGLWIKSVASITLAVADGATVTDGTLIAHAATYGSAETFPIVISDAGLTLKSYMGAASTTIDGGLAIGGVATLEIGDFANVTIGGEDSGFTIITDKTGGIWVPVGSSAGATGLRVLYNTFQAKDQGESHGIWIEAVLQDNTSPVQTALFDNNDFSQATAFSQGGGPGAVGTAILIAQASDGIISNNTAFNQKYTFLAFKPEIRTGGGEEADLGAAATIDDVKIFGNVVHDNRYAAVHFSYRGSATFRIGWTTEVKIYQNQFYNNGVGIKIDDAANLVITDADPAYGIVISYNDIYNNTNTAWDSSSVNQYGLWNRQTPDDVDARYNWWGVTGGPSAGTDAKASTTALGNGDAVSTDVLYDPWLTELQATVVTDGIRSYGSDALVLATGWNTLSVPVGLKGTGDTFGEIQAMGDYLADYVGGYWYNASTTAWVGIDNSTTLEPGKGFYIQMSAASRFPVLYFDGGLHLPSYGMYAGWNLIGSMFGIDTGGDYGVNEGAVKKPNVALDSIQSTGSVIISPSVPGQTLAWATTVADSSVDMVVGESYWVFMLADATLAGFEVTPFYFTWTP